MDQYTAATYGDAIAEVYDLWHRECRGAQDDATVAAVEFLAALAGAGPVLELGVGTGRVAIPLAARGIEVVGVDASVAMLDELRAKPGGDRVTVHIGDMAAPGLPNEAFTAVYVVASTLFCLTSQQQQATCFREAAARLAPGGAFVVEAFTPDVARFDRGQRVHARHVGVDEVRLDAAVHDPVTQTVRSQHVVLAADRIRLYPVVVRYAWPSELDLMAQLAGLTLQGRWGGWRREPYTAASPGHVSVYINQSPGPAATD